MGERSPGFAARQAERMKAHGQPGLVQPAAAGAKKDPVQEFADRLFRGERVGLSDILNAKNGEGKRGPYRDQLLNLGEPGLRQMLTDYRGQLERLRHEDSVQVKDLKGKIAETSDALLQVAYRDMSAGNYLAKLEIYSVDQLEEMQIAVKWALDSPNGPPETGDRMTLEKAVIDWVLAQKRDSQSARQWNLTR